MPPVNNPGPFFGAAQTVGGSTLPASPQPRQVFMKTSGGSSGLYVCLSVGVWTLLDTSAHSGTVTSVSVISANGFAGTVATATTTPAITLTTTITGILSGNGTAISAASTTGSGAVVLATSPTLVTPILGVASATTINRVTLTTPAMGSTLTIIDGKTLTVNKTISFTAADDTGVYTLPTGTKTLLATDGSGTGLSGVTLSAIVPNTVPTAGQLHVGNAGGTAFGVVSMSGDATLASTGAITLASTISAAGPIGSATVAPIITYDAKGRLTTVTSATITPAVGSVTGLGTGVATALGVNVGSAGAFVTFNGAGGTPSSLTGTNITGTAASLTAGTASAVAVGGITGLGTGVATALAVNAGSAGAFVVNGGALGSPSTAGTLPAHTLGGTISGGGNQINNVIIGTSTPLAGSFTTLNASTSITDGGLTAGRVTFAGASGILSDDADMTFATDTLTVTKFGATTLTGTIAGGGQQLNNIIIGTSTPLAGSFTTGNFSSTLAAGSTTITGIVTTTAGATLGGATGMDIGFNNLGGTLAVGQSLGWTASASVSVPKDTRIGRSAAGVIRLLTTDDTTANGSIVGSGLNFSGSAINFPGLGTSSVATTGTVCWTTGTGLINVDTTTTCLLSSSKYKKNSRPLDLGLATVLKLKPVAYFLKKKFNSTGLGEQVGFFAEDVAEVDPRLVSLEEDGSPHAVRYQQLTSVLAAAMQDLHAQYSALEARFNTLWSRVNA